MLVGILQTGHIADVLEPRHGDIDGLFRRLLGGNGFEFRTWAVVDNDFPDSPQDADAWLVTGSKHGVYDDLDWLPPLEALMRDIRDAGRPLVGVCFGHQLIAQAFGGRVVKYPGGWNVGRQSYTLGDETVRLNAWHQDQVVELPEGAEVVMASPGCAYAALSYGPGIFTVQPHPEFDAALVDDMWTERGYGTVPTNQVDRERAAFGPENEAHRITEMMVETLAGRRKRDTAA